MQFVHVPKCAGSTVEYQMKKLGKMVGINQPQWGHKKNCGQPGSPWHHPASCYNIKTFTILRHPFDRFISALKYNKISQTDVDALLDRLENKGRQGYDNHFQSYDWFNIDKVDEVYILECPDSRKQLLLRHGIDLDFGVRRNQSTTNQLKLTGEQTEKIKQLCTDDLKIYTFWLNTQK